MQRRRLLASAALGGLAGLFGLSQRSARAATPAFEVERSPAEWRRRLTPVQYSVLREHDTERPGSSPLNKEHRNGVFACAGCELPLFRSAVKFESGTGWPSFYTPIDKAVAITVDRGLLMARTEVHCRRCGGHLGHVFPDGPRPTGLRYCMNGAALDFHPA